MQGLATLFQGHFDEARWALKTHPFWTLPHSLPDMASIAPELYRELCNSALVVFKGDLNYRKLLADRTWDPTTPFKLATDGFCPAMCCALRTNKSDVIAGLAPGQAASLQEQDPQWLFQGSFGVIQVMQ